MSARARVVLGGLEQSGVAGCLKHYPGLGGTPADTHLEGACAHEILPSFR